MSLAFQIALLHLFHTFGWFTVDLQQYMPTLLAVTLTATVVESLPIDDWDNVTVPFAAWAAHSLLSA